MDVDELLSFKPVQTPKRAAAEALEDAEKTKQNSTNKRQKKTQNVNLEITETLNSEQEKINIDEIEEFSGDILDESSLRKLILVFEKRYLKNQEMRMKFPDSPNKFMESEVDLYSVIQDLKSLATTPDLYPILVDLEAVSSILELLLHPNTDISVAVVDLLQELTDVDILNESLEGAEILIESLKTHQICALIVQNLERLNDINKEEADGVHNSLAIIENLAEMRPDICKEAGEQGLIHWILKNLKQKSSFDINKLYSSEILSILLQTENENRLLLGSIDGIDILLQQLAVFKKHDPVSTEEQEFMENLFNCLCSALMAKENRERFLKGEGLQLMNLMLREKKMSRNGSLKVLDHAMSGTEGKENCNKFVDILGLRTIFPLFMKTPKKSKKRLLSADEHEEHVTSIIASMLRNCRGSQRQRILVKFTENDYEKIDRLLELHFKYLEKVNTTDNEIESQSQNENADDYDYNYLKRLSGGLFTLQLVDYIILEVCSTSENIKQRVVQILNLRKASLKTIRNIMREYAGNLGDANDSDWRNQEQAYILSLIDRF